MTIWLAAYAALMLRKFGSNSLVFVSIHGPRTHQRRDLGTAASTNVSACYPVFHPPVVLHTSTMSKLLHVVCDNNPCFGSVRWQRVHL